MGRGQVGDQVISDALRVVRRMDGGGTATSNRRTSWSGTKALLIDVAFAADGRPVAQAVDLANMMLTHSAHQYPEYVYEQALGVFTAEDVAEAFAACRASPCPAATVADPCRRGDLIGRFRQLAPSEACRSSSGPSAAPGSAWA